MKKCKRDQSERAYGRGYRVGFCGRPRDNCPHCKITCRQAWFNGWRDGWTDHVQGSVGVSFTPFVGDGRSAFL